MTLLGAPGEPQGASTHHLPTSALERWWPPTWCSNFRPAPGAAAASGGRCGTARGDCLGGAGGATRPVVVTGARWSQSNGHGVWAKLGVRGGLNLNKLMTTRIRIHYDNEDRREYRQ